MKVSNEVILNNVDVSTSQTSAAYSLYQVYGYFIQANITGSPVGTIKLQASGDPGSYTPYDTMAPLVWTDIANSSQSVNGAGTASWNVNLAFYSWVRVVYTAASGSGHITARMNTKGS